MGTIFNIWGNYFGYNTSDSKDEADGRALKSDWGVTGDDLKAVLDRIFNEIEVAR
jgi:hypothetical protein